MAKRPRLKRIIKWSVITISLLLGIPFVLSIITCFMGDTIQNSCISMSEIDITSGKIRFKRVILGHESIRRESETIISKLYKPSAERSVPEWRAVNIRNLCAGMNFHPNYHSAIFLIMKLEKLLNSIPNDIELQRQTVDRFMYYLPKGDSDFYAGEFWRELSLIVKEHGSFTAEDLSEIDAKLIKEYGDN